VAPGGCTTLVFDSAKESLVRSFVSLSGTLQNCAGGPTPWGTWLSCEENVGDPLNKDKDGKSTGYTRDHGWVFDVKPEAASAPQPLTGLGRFVHEAVAIDPTTGIVYLTEDSNPAGFYRFIPNTPGDLVSSGKLEMLSAIGRPDTRKRVPPNAEFDVKWVPIADPTLGHTPKTRDGKGVFTQGQKLGGSSFARLEGVFFADSRMVITATSGGNASQGQVWEYTPGKEKLRILFESPSKEILNMPDNLCATPQGCVVLCEDGGRRGQRLQGLTPTGELFPFAENAMVLKGEKHGFKGDFRGGEWSGVCFSQDGKWMFANMQSPGVTLAITGPWQDGPF
jgi:secreted PhoX family phosphatase